jgi:transposase-like protein
MKCRFCDHELVYTHSTTSQGVERFKCAACQHTLTDTFDTLYYRRQVSEAQVHQILQSHQAGVSLRGISRITGRSITRVTQIVPKASEKAQMVHNQEVNQIDTESAAADEFWSFVAKKTSELSPSGN